MENIYINIVLLTYILTYIIDYSGITTEINKTIYKLRKREYRYQPLMKPFGCSLCMCFWVNTIYLFYNTNNIILSLSIGVSSSLMVNIIKKIIDFYNKITY